MPDALKGKGQALAIIAADWFEKLEKPESWAEYSKTPQALSLRKGNRFGAAFNELGEDLKQWGLRTHYLGALAGEHAVTCDESAQSAGLELKPIALSQVKAPFSQIAVRQVSAVKPLIATVLGRSVPDYSKTRTSPAPRLVPLEVVFRFGVPQGSSLLERTARDPHYLAGLGFPELKAHAGEKWEFPVLELFTKLESSDRILSLSEALAISGLNGMQLQEVLFKTAWVAGFLRYLCARADLDLADGKLEWGVGTDSQIFLVDAIGPDELRILKGGVQISKEFLRTHYRKSDWFEATTRAKEIAKSQGLSDWKKFVAVQPQLLPADVRALASQVYLSLANELTQRRWFSDAWEMSRVVSELKKYSVTP